MEHHTVVAGDNWYPIARKLAPGATNAQIAAFAATLAQRNGFPISVPAPFGFVLHYDLADVPVPPLEEPPAEEPARRDATNTGIAGAGVDEGDLTIWPGGDIESSGTYNRYHFPNGVTIAADDVVLTECLIESSPTTTYTIRWDEIGGEAPTGFTMTVSGTGSAGSPIDIATPFTLDGTEAIGGSFTLFDTGNTIYAGSIYPSSTSLFRMQVSGNGNQLGQNPSFALASGDIIRATVHGRLA